MRQNERTVLVVEDDRAAQSTFTLLLRQKGYAVLTADDGAQALDQVHRHRVDLVILDLLMPNKDGIETLIELKREHPKLRVIVLAGGGVQCRIDFRTMVSNLGADGVLQKPVPTSAFLEAVDAQFAGTG